MKLKILPPTLRDKKRYIAFEAMFQRELGRDEIISILLDASNGLYGACGTGSFDLWIVRLWHCNSFAGENVTGSMDEHLMKGILRCRREEIDTVVSILPMVTSFRGKPVIFHTLGISGTIKSAIKNFIKL